MLSDTCEPGIPCAPLEPEEQEMNGNGAGKCGDVESTMYVRKRNGNLEEVYFDKIVQRISVLGHMNPEKPLKINYQNLAIKIINQLCDQIETSRIDELTAEQCATVSDPDFATLAARIAISNHHKETQSMLFFNAMKCLYEFRDVHGEHYPLVSNALWEFVQEHCTELESMIDYTRDYAFDYFGFKTLERSYLFRVNKQIVERPQDMWMRVAVGIHATPPITCTVAETLEHIKQTYDCLSQKYFIHATPTLFNSGTARPQMSSCYLLAMKDDSLDGIYDTLKDCAIISKYSGGIGVHIHNIRAKGTHIKGTNGISNGIVPMLKVFNNTAKYVDQGGGKRHGSIAIYLEPWHADIFDFLEIRKNHGNEDMKSRDLFTALWIPDLFMERVKDPEGMWSLFCPHECPGLSDVYGDEFRVLYERYEAEGRARETISARKLWLAVLDSQMETGTPYMLYKDSINRKSNQKNVGVIRSSNLCCEVTEYSDPGETAVCNLASVGLPTFVDVSTKEFNYEKLHDIVKVMTYNLNRIIDVNFYPIPSTSISNKRHRPIGIGVQGLADTFVLMGIAFHSEEAKVVNKRIFETIYHAALTESNRLAQVYGAYDTFAGSPASQGILQFDMWGVNPGEERYAWRELKLSIQEHGLRNSLLVSPMPTASTAQIFGFNECFEPFTSNIYSRKTLAGEFVIPNKYLIQELIDLGLWNETMRTTIIANKGSVAGITAIPETVRNKYKTVWEIPMKHVIDMAIDRGAFVCQSQSMNLWMESPVYGKLTSMHMYAWEKGLKTGIYYLRRKATHQAQAFTIEPDKAASAHKEEEEHHEVCEMCSA